MLTQETLKGILHYNPDTGLFTWLVDSGNNKLKGTIAGTKRLDGYVQIRYKSKFYLAHRLAVLYMEGVIPEYVDHKDHVRDNNRWNNLRQCTASQNSMNISITSSNTSGFKGVSFHKEKRKWRGTLGFQGKQYHCGYWDTPEQAAEAVKLKRVELHGEFVNHG